MRQFGLIGYPLGHSFSKGYFTEKFNKERLKECVYDNYPLESINLLPSLIEDNPELLGLNVTIPYKEKVIPLIDRIDRKASEIGAVNTIKICRIGTNFLLEGFNTDYIGFEQPLKKVLKKYHKKALILGTGGASMAVKYVLKNLDIEYLNVSRNKTGDKTITYNQVTADLIQDYQIIINTSPLGMYPNIDTCPDIPYASITKKHILYDLVYNPQKTLFLKMGEQKKATLINGLPMLYLQAEQSWEIWNL
jgi:shikimate dehydrogenase